MVLYYFFLFVVLYHSQQLYYAKVLFDRPPTEEYWSNHLLSNTITSKTNITRSAKVLNFFPVPVEEECTSKDGRRKGICMNTYECRMQNGVSSGRCALGFGVCCIFTVSCGGTVINNLTYFTNPNYPQLYNTNATHCNLVVRKTDPEIAQIRLEFLHFHLGQPNRRTGVCDQDIFAVVGAAQTFRLCGLNSGQHVHLDIEPHIDQLDIRMLMSRRRSVGRWWEIRIVQVPFPERAPAGCLQYHIGPAGVLQTMNFAENGRHLAQQDYSICIRQEANMCSIVYEPCHRGAFRISPEVGGGGDVVAGSGDGARQFAEQECDTDRIVLPCVDEEFLDLDGAVTSLGNGVCNVVHCGNSLCPTGDDEDESCRVESFAIPFVVGVHFGIAPPDDLPDDNLGMCLTYKQMPCIN